MTKAKITRLFSAVTSQKNGNVYLSGQAVVDSTNSILGQTTEKRVFVNIELASLSDGIKALMTEGQDGRFVGDRDNDLADFIPVNFVSMREDTDEETGFTRFWCNL